jgi:hypothetical protein
MKLRSAPTISQNKASIGYSILPVTASAEGIELAPVYAERPASYPRAFTAMRAAAAQALVIVAAPEFNRDAEILGALATDAGLPTMCEWGQMAARGCLLGYGPSRARAVAARGRLRAAGSARRGAGRAPDRGTGALRVRREPENRQAARSDHSHLGAATRRSARPMSCCLLHCVRPQLALFGLRAMSDLSP